MFYFFLLDTVLLLLCVYPWLSILSAIGQEHEVLLHDKLKERNLSFLGKPLFELLITILPWMYRLLEGIVKEVLELEDLMDVISIWFATNKQL